MPSRAGAACPWDATYNDDDDGYSTGPLTGCPTVYDCNDGDPDINPSELELVGDDDDQDCDGRDALRRYLSTGFFSSGTWTTTGTVSFPDGDLQVGSTTSGPSTARRTYSVPRNTGFTGLMIDIEGRWGAACDVVVTTGLSGVPGGTPHTEELPTATGTAWIEIGEVTVPHVLKEVKFQCPPSSFVRLDWFVVQNADREFPPAAELSIDWHDTRTPGGGYTSTVVRSDDARYIYMGSDVAGVARVDSWSGDQWETSFGTGEDTLALAGVMSVGDLLPEPSGSALYVLMGDPLERGSNVVEGGLWYSPDRGDTWSMLADSYSHTDDSDPAEDDVAGFGLMSQCPQADGATAHAWKYGGGRLLQGDWYGGGEVLYVANADDDARGVSVYDSATGDVCPLAHTGDALPAQVVGAILRVDVYPDSTPALVVGYRARSDGGEGVYVCELPAGGMDCSTASAYCEALPGSEGIDVRDLQLDEWLAEDLSTAVLVADAGNRPDDNDADGMGDDVCTIVDPGIDSLGLSDTFGAVEIDAYDRVADGDDLPGILAAELTGLSVDPGASYVFANVPQGGGSYYDADRMYRVYRPDMELGFDWTPLNSEADDGSTIFTEDTREAIRRGNTDAVATWLEEGIIGAPNVFPARFSPGAGHDTEWLAWTFEDETALAVVSTNFNAWLVGGLDGVWNDDDGDPYGIEDSEEETYWWFLPDTHEDERRTYQTMVSLEATPDAAGWVWSAVGDHGLADLDAVVPQASGASRNGAEVDCLWNDGFRAGGTSVSVGLDGSVWATLGDQSISAASADTYYPHDGGVVRFAYEENGESYTEAGGWVADPGWYWTFAGAGYLDDLGNAVPNLDTTADPPYDTYRLCQDRDFETRFSAPMDPDNASPFSGGDTDVAAESLGQPWQVRALDRSTALVAMKPTSVEAGSTTYDTVGGWYATVSSGVNVGGAYPVDAWLPVPFDGDYAIAGTSLTGTCDDVETFTTGRVELVHPGADSFTHDVAPADGIADDVYPADGYPDDFLLDVLVAVTDSSALVSESGTYYYPCALARVQVFGDDAGGLDADWTWIPLVKHVEPYGATDCGVNGRNIAGATVPAWANEAYIWGNYYRDQYSTGTTPQPRRGGGVCAVDLDSYDTTLVVNPGLVVDPITGETVHEYGIGAVAPHPQVSDLLAILPTLDVTNWKQCDYRRVEYGTRCSYPWPLLAERGVGGWQLTALHTQPPTPRVNDARWSDLELDMGGEVTESWLVVATGGSGTWRGVVEW